MAENGQRRFIDVHTHILPAFDDGSGSSAQSIQMLRSLSGMGACGVILTPHFYARRDEPADFFSARKQTAEHLLKKLDSARQEEGTNFPSLYIGAEVEYFNAMSICSELDEMCIGGTRYLLCEMPFYRWTSAMIDELRSIKKKRGITPIIAHVERYFKFFREEMLDGMIADGLLIQSNAEAFTGLGRGRVLKLLSEGKIHLLGSDCHNMEKRAPNMAAAFDVIEKRLGAETVKGLCDKSIEIFKDAEKIYTGI